MAERSISARINDWAYDQELEVVRKFVSSVNDKTARYFFLNLFSPPGYGKTTLLMRILSMDEYRNIIPTSFVATQQFDKTEKKGEFLREFLFKIIKDISTLLPITIAALPDDYEQFSDEEKIAEILCALATRARAFKKPPLLLIDDYDIMPEETRYWLESKVFSGFARAGVAVILTSEHEVRFGETLDLLMRIECRRLMSMRAAYIAEVLPEYKGLEDVIYRVTGGVPGLVVKFMEQLESSLVQSHSDFCAYEYDFTRKYYRDIFEANVLAGWDQEIRQTLLALSLLRRFDVKVLGGILPEVKALANLYEGYGDRRYLDRIDDLRSWREWQMQGGYALDEAFRVMLQEYVRVEQPDLYQEINEKAAQLYRGWLRQEYRESYFVELLYHRLCSFRFKENHGLCTTVDQGFRDKIAKELLSDFNGEIVGRISKSDSDRLDKILERDPDLKFYVKEIRCAIADLIRKEDDPEVSCN